MRKAVARIFNALKKDARITTLERIHEGKQLQTIADELDMSYAGVRSYYDDFEDADLIKETEDGYTLKKRGEQMLEIVADVEQLIAETEMEETEKKARTLIDDRIGLDSSKGQELLERLLEESRNQQSEE